MRMEAKRQERDIIEVQKRPLEFLRYEPRPYYRNTSKGTDTHLASIEGEKLFTIDAEGGFTVNLLEGLEFRDGTNWISIPVNTRFDLSLYKGTRLQIRTPGADPYIAFLQLENAPSDEGQETGHVQLMGVMKLGISYGRHEIDFFNTGISKSADIRLVEEGGKFFLTIGNPVNIRIMTSRDNEPSPYTGPIDLGRCTGFTIHVGDKAFKYDLPVTENEEARYEYSASRPNPTCSSTRENLLLDKLPPEDSDLRSILELAVMRTKTFHYTVDSWGQLLVEPLNIAQLLTPGTDRVVINFYCNGETVTFVGHQKFMGHTSSDGVRQTGSIPFEFSGGKFDKIRTGTPIVAYYRKIDGTTVEVKLNVQVPKETGEAFSATNIGRGGLPNFTTDQLNEIKWAPTIDEANALEVKYGKAASDSEAQATESQSPRSSIDYLRPLTREEIAKSLKVGGDPEFIARFVGGWDLQDAKGLAPEFVAAVMSHILNNILLPKGFDMDPMWFAGDGVNVPTGGLLAFLKMRKEVESFLQRLNAALKIIKPGFKGPLVIRVAHAVGFVEGLQDCLEALRNALTMAGNMFQSGGKTGQKENFNPDNLVKMVISPSSLDTTKVTLEKIWQVLEGKISDSKGQVDPGIFAKDKATLNFAKLEWLRISGIESLQPVDTTVFDGTGKKVVGEPNSHPMLFLREPDVFLAAYEKIVSKIQELTTGYKVDYRLETGLDIDVYNL